MKHQLTIVESCPNHAFGLVGNVVLYVWRKVTTAEAVRQLGTVTDLARATGAGKALALGAVEVGATLPDGAIREQMGRLMNDAWASVVSASALSFEGAGFYASAVRGVATGLALVSRAPFPHKVFGSVPEAATWLCAKAIDTQTACPDLSELTEAMQKLRGS